MKKISENRVVEKKDYDFVNSIRGIAMMFIVAEHCVATGGHSFYYSSDLFWAFLCLLQLTKFGTIAFFLIAGFLIGDKFHEYSPLEYFRRRFINTFGPWVFWSLLYVLIDNYDIILSLILDKSPVVSLSYFFNKARGLYLYSNYWFIINFMVSISVLLLFRKYLYSPVFGIILGFFTLFYSVNIHHEWIGPQHTTAVLGFVFFLWLGAQLRKHWDKVNTALMRLPYALMVLLFALTYFLSIRESMSLQYESVDTTNTLRFSNILYSLVVFCILLKIGKFRLIERLRPRQTTFGIYLIHYLLIVFLLPRFVGKVDVESLTALQFITFRLVCFLIMYTITYFIVSAILLSPAKKLIGN